MIPDKPGRYRRRRVIVETVDIFTDADGLHFGQVYDQHIEENEWLERLGDLDIDYGASTVEISRAMVEKGR